jgi:hypothetical protein
VNGRADVQPSRTDRGKHGREFDEQAVLDNAGAVGQRSR